MNSPLSSTPAPSPASEIADQLALAVTVTLTLAEKHVRVIAALANGRRPTLMVDRMPDGVRSVVKRSHPNGFGGFTLVEAAEFEGCQLEWMHDIAGVRLVGAVGHA